MAGCGRGWKKLLEISPGLGQCCCTSAQSTVLPCAVTCSSLAGRELCTHQQDAGDNSVESVLVCREVWLL